MALATHSGRAVELVQNLEPQTNHGDLIGHLAVLDVVLFTVANVATRQPVPLPSGDPLGVGSSAAAQSPCGRSVRPGIGVTSSTTQGSRTCRGNGLAAVFDLGWARWREERVGGWFMDQSRHPSSPQIAQRGSFTPLAFRLRLHCRSSVDVVTCNPRITCIQSGRGDLNP
jgi:hypothetical protein